jgi:type IV secretory pathway VirB2 component (pilin)
MNIRLKRVGPAWKPAALATMGLVLLTATVQAGGTIGWAAAVDQFSTEGVSVGAAAVVLGIIAVGAILMFGITGLITTVVMVCLGGALMANAQNIATGLFQGGAGGGSILATSYAAAAPATGPALRVVR